MPFEVICMKNRRFWSRVVTALAGFAMVITAMAVVFPLNQTDNSSQVQIQTTTTQEYQENSK